MDSWADAPLTPRAWQREALPVIEQAFAARQKGIVSAIMGSGKSVLQAKVVRDVMRTIYARKLQSRSIVICAPRQNLVNQLAKTIEQFNPGLVGKFYAREKGFTAPIVVCCAASLGKLHVALGTINRSVSLMISDECHGTESDTYLEVVPKLNPVQLLGFTATPMRSAPKESLSLWDDVIFRYSMNDALRDGVLVPIRVARLPGMEDCPLDEACLDMMREAEGPGIVSAYSVDDAEGYCAWLGEQGFSALAIHSRLSDKEQTSRLAKLEAGEVRALVHVSLLAEGVDLPWLRWICLRRKVGASVRFLQEIGRPMRSYPGKTECVVMDPHLLMGRFGLKPSEAIGKALEEAAEAEAAERSPANKTFTPSDEQAIALDRLIVHMYEVRDAMVNSKLTSVKAIPDNGWTLAPISQPQVDAILSAKRACRNMPDGHRESIRTLCTIPWALNRGEASTLLDILQGTRRWAWSEAEKMGDSVPDTVKWNVKWSPAPLAGVTIPESTAFTGIKALEKAKKRHEKHHGG